MNLFSGLLGIQQKQADCPHVWTTLASLHRKVFQLRCYRCFKTVSSTREEVNELREKDGYAPI